MSHRHFSSLRLLILTLGLFAAATLGWAATPTLLPRFVDLGADKCIPCKMMMPVLAELTRDYKGQLDVVFFDVWKDRSKGEEYGIHLIPTQIFFDATGKEVYRHEGFISKKEILAKWAELGINLSAPAKAS
ncbi:MAG: thioredoxin family protein [Opitutae bacterium]